MLRQMTKLKHHQYPRPLASRWMALTRQRRLASTGGPSREEEKNDILQGLGRRPVPEISARWLYDDYGSDLFERITKTEEYYLTRKEIELLEAESASMACFLDEKSNPDPEVRRVIVELGAGSGRKTALLLDSVKAISPKHQVNYVPIDVSEAALEDNARKYNLAGKGFKVTPFVNTYQDCLDEVSRIPGRKTFLFLGSSLGNYNDEECVQLMKLVCDNMGPRDRLLVGVDTPHGAHKSAETIEAAYNDKEGITAEFTLNALRHVNKAAGLDFQPEKFRHIARYDESKESILTWVESLEDQEICLKEGNKPVLHMQKADRIFMEQSRKFSIRTMNNIGTQAGLMVTRSWATDDDCHMMVEYQKDLIKDATKISDWIFHSLVERGIRGEGLLIKPIHLRHPFIFYKGHISAFYSDKALPAEAEIPGFESTEGKGRVKELADIFERGLDPEIGSEEGKCHRHSPEQAEWPPVKEIEAFDKGTRSAFRSHVQKVSGWNRLALLALEHEHMHQETLMYMAANADELQRSPIRKLCMQTDEKNAPAHTRSMAPPTALSTHNSKGQVAEVTGAHDVVLGATEMVERETGFVWDNEFPHQLVNVDSFAASTLPVTNSEFLRFVLDGGYRNPSLWGEYADMIDGSSKIEEKADQPASWLMNPEKPGEFQVRTLLDGPQDMSVAGNWPAVVSLAEAQAYCLWLGNGARIMTEPEYHLIFHQETLQGNSTVYDEAKSKCNSNWKYAGVVPVGSMNDATKVYGISDLVGNGWEWTATPFEPFPGFKPMPEYSEYSADFFGGQHFVMKGGSPFTECQLQRLSFRNWFQARYRYVWGKFRVCWDQ